MWNAHSSTRKPVAGSLTAWSPPLPFRWADGSFDINCAGMCCSENRFISCLLLNSVLKSSSQQTPFPPLGRSAAGQDLHFLLESKGTEHWVSVGEGALGAPATAKTSSTAFHVEHLALLAFSI